MRVSASSASHLQQLSSRGEGCGKPDKESARKCGSHVFAMYRAGELVLQGSLGLLS